MCLCRSPVPYNRCLLLQLQSEYVAECDKRREFISSFSGSAGMAVVTLQQALLWTDGRYHLQASQQLDENWTPMKDGVPDVPKLEEWLAKVELLSIMPRHGSGVVLQRYQC